MSNVVHFKTREVIEAPALTDEQKMRALRFSCVSAIVAAARLLRISFGLDLALRTLGSVADELRNEGRVS